MTDSLVWSIALPLSGAILSVLLPRAANGIGLASVLGSLAAALAVIWTVADQGPLTYAIGGWTPGLGIALRADGLSALLLLLSALVAVAASVYATAYFRQAEQRQRFWTLWLLLLSALHALFLAADLFNLYVTLELLGLSAAALTALSGQREALEAALRYLLLGLLGSLAFLAGVALLYTGYGSLDISTLTHRLSPGLTGWSAAALMTSGLLIKTALFPLHFWLPPAHANAPAPVSAILSALVVKAAFYLVLRLWLEPFASLSTPELVQMLGVLGAIAVIWGSWQALQAERLKLLAAYSTLAQIGYLFLFLPLILETSDETLRHAALGGLLLMALTHGLAKSALFLAAGVVQQHAGHDRIAELRGTAQALPATTFTLALAGVALIGLPPSGAFLGKWQLIAGALQAELWWMLGVVLAGSLLAAGYVFRLLGHAFGQARYPARSLSIGRQEIPALGLGLAATLLLGLFSAPVWSLLAGLAPAGGLNP
ncbi:MAG: proton-conducting transporter membrane subunit [Gammaproteobacteria bacterium]|nr:proton-conducting transporter membrane subunit [Gammaproteobacteria bacterium]